MNNRLRLLYLSKLSYFDFTIFIYQNRSKKFFTHHFLTKLSNMEHFDDTMVQFFVENHTSSAIRCLSHRIHENQLNMIKNWTCKSKLIWGDSDE